MVCNGRPSFQEVAYFYPTRRNRTVLLSAAKFLEVSSTVVQPRSATIASLAAREHPENRAPSRFISFRGVMKSQASVGQSDLSSTDPDAVSIRGGHLFRRAVPVIGPVNHDWRALVPPPADL